MHTHGNLDMPICLTACFVNVGGTNTGRPCEAAVPPTKPPCQPRRIWHNMYTHTDSFLTLSNTLTNQCLGHRMFAIYYKGIGTHICKYTECKDSKGNRDDPAAETVCVNQDPERQRHTENKKRMEPESRGREQLRPGIWVIPPHTINNHTSQPTGTRLCIHML